MTDKSHPPIMIPVIKEFDPATFARDLVDAQPMTGPVGQIFSVRHGYAPPFKLASAMPGYRAIEMPNVPEGFIVVLVTSPVAKWIEEQPIHMWKEDDVDLDTYIKFRYCISPELFTLMALRWA